MYMNVFCSTAELTLAESKFALGKTEEALININKAIDIPMILSKEEHYSVRGNIYLILNKPTLALADFDEAIRLDPNFSGAYADRAVAKSNIAVEMKMVSNTIYGGVNGEHFSPVWVFPSKASKRSVQQLESAMADCDQAIKLSADFPYPFYIRGQIKKMTGQDGACYDLLKAKQMGFPVAEELMNGCK
jgi:tetratricopeptide (TPR) repeat protein